MGNTRTGKYHQKEEEEGEEEIEIDEIPAFGMKLKRINIKKLTKKEE